MDETPERQIASFKLQPEQVETIKLRMLSWSKQFSILTFLDSNNYRSAYDCYDCLLAAGAKKIITGDEGDVLSRVASFHDENKDWLFGHICYDYKNNLESKLFSAHQPKHAYPLIHFFVPHIVCYINRNRTSMTIAAHCDPARVFAEISAFEPLNGILPSITFTSVTGKEKYIETIAALRKHIADGDCYEINYCNASYSENAALDPYLAFQHLNTISPAPFAAFYRLNDEYMLCASPERYMLKVGPKITSQPIKGTARRGDDEKTDYEMKEQLRTSIKERAENVMIVDLVRNDMARACETGTVKVDELFGIYTYPQVHQMISTISGTLKADMHFSDAIRHSFPMGSMTGAPKHKVMQLIEQYEDSYRGLFSGTVGYITPSGDFDFNVVIRSLFYNSKHHYLSYQTGGAITFDSIAEQEWEEMRLKAWALERIFSDSK